MPTENEALVRGVIELLFNQKRAHLIAAFYSPECRGGSPDGPFDSCDGFRAHFEKYATAFPDFPNRYQLHAVGWGPGSRALRIPGYACRAIGRLPAQRPDFEGAGHDD